MLAKYKVVYKGGQDEIIEKKSTIYCDSCSGRKRRRTHLAFIEAMKKKYWDARHNCFAYVIGEREDSLQRCSDDGEPGGTAGKPMLDVLLGRRNPQYG